MKYDKCVLPRDAQGTHWGSSEVYPEAKNLNPNFNPQPKKRSVSHISHRTTQWTNG